jgi:hydrogenase maturation protease
MTDMSVRHIICFGNPLHGDDGFGTAVFYALCDYDLPHDIRVLDGGTSSLSALNLFEACSYAIIVDAVHKDKPQRKLNWFKPDQFMVHNDDMHLSSHGLGVGSVLKGLKILEEDGEKIPDLDILTCEIELPTAFQMRLSEPVAAMVGQAVDQIMQRLQGEVP